MEFDEVFRVIGAFGRYQKLNMLWIACCYMVTGVNFYIQVFYAGKTDHWCRSWPDENCSSLGITDGRMCATLKRNLSVPVVRSIEDENSTYEFDQCNKYNVSGVSLMSALEFGQSEAFPDIIPCDDGWEHDKTTFPSTIIMDFELVCGRSYLPSIAQSSYFAGFLVGSLLAGILSDVFGRRTTILAALVAINICGVSLAASPNIWVFMALRFLIGIVARSLTLSAFVLATEFVPASARVLVTNIMFIACPLGYVSLAALAKTIPSWRMTHLVATSVNIPLLILAVFIISESPRWLLSQKRVEDAENICRKIARRNHNKVPYNFSETVRKLEKVNDEVRGSVFDLFRSRISSLIILTMCFNWFVHSFVYFGLSLSTSTFNIDPYMSFAILAAVEIPSCLACVTLADRLGRRLLSMTTMIIAGITSCLSPLIPLGIYRALFVSVGKLFGSVAFSLSYTWAAEVVPTYLRTSGVGLLSLVSRIGGVIVPLLLLLEEVWVSLPVVVIGALSIIGGLLCLLLPETKNRPLPTTIKDVENLYRESRNIAVEGKGTAYHLNDTEKEDEKPKLSEDESRLSEDESPSEKTSMVGGSNS